MRVFFLTLALMISLRCSGQEPWATIERNLGLKGSVQPGDVYKVVLPRTDLNVRRGDVTVAPTFALSSWMAFEQVGDGVIAHGDLCLLEREVNPVMTELVSSGIEASALHNHLGGEEPRVMFLHFWGHGNAARLAETLRRALDRAGGVPAPAQQVGSVPDQAVIEKLMHQAGKVNAGVLQFAFPRPFPIRMHGMVLPPAMGMATAINFQSAGEQVAATGDFVLREEELGSVLRTLRANNIEVTAIHNHMLDDEPRMIFVHFWGEGTPVEVASGLRAALDKLAATSGAEPTSFKRWDFEDAAVKALPAYLDAPRGRWEIQEIASAPLGAKSLLQIARSPRPYFNLAVVKDDNFRDVRLSVKYKPLSGYVDQGGGVIWRYQDPENYYLARANPLEHDFRVFRVAGGKRELLEKAEVDAPAGQWHTLSVTMRGSHIVCELNGRKYLSVHDETFKNSGLVGVWTKADAHTAFDELIAESFDPQTGR